jgi:hypothetical protein
MSNARFAVSSVILEHLATRRDGMRYAHVVRLLNGIGN